jgi:hypothetical protein
MDCNGTEDESDECSEDAQEVQGCHEVRGPFPERFVVSTRSQIVNTDKPAMVETWLILQGNASLQAYDTDAATMTPELCTCAIGTEANDLQNKKSVGAPLFSLFRPKAQRKVGTS